MKRAEMVKVHADDVSQMAIALDTACTILANNKQVLTIDDGGNVVDCSMQSKEWWKSFLSKVGKSEQKKKNELSSEEYAAKIRKIKD